MKDSDFIKAAANLIRGCKERECNKCVLEGNICSTDAIFGNKLPEDWKPYLPKLNRTK